jgi:hypothetical protein
MKDRQLDLSTGVHEWLKGECEMKPVSRLAIAALLSVGSIAPAGTTLSAPMSVPRLSVEAESDVQDARWVRRCNMNRCRNVWVGPRLRPRVVIRPRAVVRPRVVIRTGGSRHVRWCLNRYQTYDPSTNTYIAYGGVVRRCRSPYR